MPSPPAPVTVRPALAADVDRLVPLFGAYRAFYHEHPDPSRERRYLSERLDRGEAVVFLAEDRGRAVGFTLLYPSYSSVSLRPIWVLNDLYVRPESRRGGVGGRLLVAAREFARASGAEYITLETAVDNPAQRLYEAHGWTRDSAFLHYELRL
jgi:ribosomal protein S18 acetylase RimI-like enzyme